MKKGAPAARAVSDRWHVVKNRAACVSVLLACCLAQRRRAAGVAAASGEQGEHPSGEPASYQRTRAERRAQQARQAERQARYEPITALHKQGMKRAAMAAGVGMAARTVRHWQERRALPSAGPRKPRSRPLDSYKTYLLERWQQGCRAGAQVEREWRAKGDIGSHQAS
jgi:DNA-binding transcriptional regulator YiaG